MSKFDIKLENILGSLGAQPDSATSNADYATPTDQPGSDQTDQSRADKQKQPANRLSDPALRSLYQQYQKAKDDADKAQQAAETSQDIGNFNMAASARKTMELRWQAYQTQLQKSSGQGSAMNQSTLPSDAV